VEVNGKFTGNWALFFFLSFLWHFNLFYDGDADGMKRYRSSFLMLRYRKKKSLKIPEKKRTPNLDEGLPGRVNDIRFVGQFGKPIF
jgi:hypothetical protein